MRRRAAGALLALVTLGGCGSGGDAPPAREPTAPRGEAPAPDPPERARPVRCPPGTADCRAATGRVIYVESVDPDGDGDLHVVLASGEQISGPGITVVDVRPGLRPRRDPRPGDLVAAAGPVYRGSYGQRQIEAIRVRFQRR